MIHLGSIVIFLKWLTYLSKKAEISARKDHCIHLKLLHHAFKICHREKKKYQIESLVVYQGHRYKLFLQKNSVQAPADITQDKSKVISDRTKSILDII